jgi:hypothetical protein
MPDKEIIIKDAVLKIFIVSESMNRYLVDKTYMDKYFHAMYDCYYKLDLITTNSGELIYSIRDGGESVRNMLNDNYDIGVDFRIELVTYYYKETAESIKENRVKSARLIVSDNDYNIWKRDETINEILN